jgi:hypothetical protein
MTGKALAWLVVLVAGVTAFTVAGAVLHGWWGDLPAAWLTGMTVGLVGIGLGSITNAFGPASSVGSGGKPGAASSSSDGLEPHARSPPDSPPKQITPHAGSSVSIVAVDAVS